MSYLNVLTCRLSGSISLCFEYKGRLGRNYLRVFLYEQTSCNRPPPLNLSSFSLPFKMNLPAAFGSCDERKMWGGGWEQGWSNRRPLGWFHHSLVPGSEYREGVRLQKAKLNTGCEKAYLPIPCLTHDSFTFSFLLCLCLFSFQLSS